MACTLVYGSIVSHLFRLFLVSLGDPPDGKAPAMLTLATANPFAPPLRIAYMLVMHGRDARLVRHTPHFTLHGLRYPLNIMSRDTYWVVSKDAGIEMLRFADNYRKTAYKCSGAQQLLSKLFYFSSDMSLCLCLCLSICYLKAKRLLEAIYAPQHFYLIHVDSR